MLRPPMTHSVLPGPSGRLNPTVAPTLILLEPLEFQPPPFPSPATLYFTREEYHHDFNPLLFIDVP